MLKIGVTGGIASGKTLVGSLLARRGAGVIDADAVAHDVYAAGSDGFSALVKTFGSEIVGADGSIDRRRLGAIVFADANKRSQLTQIVWPRTRLAIEELVRREQASGGLVCVVEAPLLIEAGWTDMVDQVWLVRAPIEAVRARLQQRGLSPEEIDSRLAAATDTAAAASAATVVVENDGDRAHLERIVDAAWQRHVAPAFDGRK
jgi:dephospho-CoA kinase